MERLETDTNSALTTQWKRPLIQSESPWATTRSDNELEISTIDRFPLDKLVDIVPEGTFPPTAPLVTVFIEFNHEFAEYRRRDS